MELQYLDLDKVGYFSILNACRSWRLVEENVLSSKVDGAVWAKERVHENSEKLLIDQALAMRSGMTTEEMNHDQIEKFVIKIILETKKIRDSNCL